MRFTVPLLALAGSAVASSSLYARQAQVIIGVINEITTALESFGTVVQSYTSGPADELTAASQKIGSITSDAVSTVKGAQTVSLSDAITIQGAVQGLQSNLEKVMAGLISKKASLVAAGEGPTVASELNAQMEGAKALQAAITSRVPPETQALATQLSAGINVALQKAIDEYADVASGPAGGSASAGGASAGGAAAGSASAGTSTAGGHAGMVGMSGGSSSTSPKGATTSAPGKPAVYTGAGPHNKVPLFGAVVLGAAVLAF